jgi:hypothetical protein
MINSKSHLGRGMMYIDRADDSFGLGFGFKRWILRVLIMILFMHKNQLFAQILHTDKIAVLEIDNQSKLNATDLYFLNHRLQSIIQQYTKGAFQVITKENVDSVLPAHVHLEDCDSKNELDIAQFIGAQFLVTSKIFVLSDDPHQLILNAKLYQTADGSLLNEKFIKGFKINDLEAQFEIFCRQLLGRSHKSTGSQRKIFLVLPIKNQSQANRTQVEGIYNQLLLEMKRQNTKGDQVIALKQDGHLGDVPQHCMTGSPVQIARCVNADYFVLQTLIDFPNRGIYLMSRVYDAKTEGQVFETDVFDPSSDGIRVKLEALSRRILSLSLD